MNNSEEKRETFKTENAGRRDPGPGTQRGSWITDPTDANLSVSHLEVFNEMGPFSKEGLKLWTLHANGVIKPHLLPLTG